MIEFKASSCRPLSGRGFWTIVALLLLLMAARQGLSVRDESQTFDEAAHLAAGYSYWKTGDFRLLPSHPPLAELFCSLPLLVLQPDFSPGPTAWREADEYAVGKKFLYQNRINADTLLFAGRLMTILLTLALALALAWWTRKRFGDAAALMSLLIFSFSPTILAHGSLVTTDLAVTAFIFGGCIAWLAYLETGSPSSLLTAGVLLGLAISSKFNGLVLYPIFLLLYLLHRWRTPRPERHHESFSRLFAALVLAPFLILCSMLFFDTRSMLQDPVIGPRLTRLTGPARVLSEVPIPAYYYVRGLHILVRDLLGGHPTYLLGSNANRGSWLYFPIALAIKTPLTTLLLLLLGAVLSAKKLRESSSVSFVWLALGLPPLFYFLVSMTSSMNIGIRHILPIYPFLCVWIGAVLFGRSHGRFTVVARASGIVLGALLIVESLSVHPNYLAFFNILAGGPQNGPRYLIDSNLDWGQDLKRLKRWTDQNRAAPLCLSYFGQADPKYYGISFQPLGSVRDSEELANLNCVVAVSSHYLFGMQSEQYEALRNLEPRDRIGYSIYVYDLRKKSSGPDSLR